MSVTILVRKHTGRSRFKPHFNRTTDRYYGTEKDYTKDLKDRGLEPYNPGGVKTPTREPYKPSTWAHEMIEAGKGKHGRVGDVWKEEAAKKGGFKRPPKGIESTTHGGSYEG